MIELTHLAPDQKVEMVGICEKKEGIILKEVVPNAYSIRVDGRTIVAGVKFFKLITEK